jgi:hypothetical protein
MVLSGAVEDCRKVAVLRALYDTDQSRSLDFFARAISSLPDTSRPEGVSVPAFAVDFLGKRVSEPVVKDFVERMAWSGYLNLSPVLRHQAAKALVAAATPADLQRYSGYPDYRALTATATADVETR